MKKVLEELTNGSGEGTFGAAAPEQFSAVVAEYIVNDVTRLPSYYATARFWNEHAARFFDLRKEPDLEGAWKHTGALAKRFEAFAIELKDHLKRVRGELSFEAGVPIVDRVAV